MKLGQTAVFNIARWILTACYGLIIVLAPFLQGVNRPFLLVTHLVAISAFWYLSQRVGHLTPDGGNAINIQGNGTLSYPEFYQFIWKLFFIEYLIFPLACILTL